MIDYQELKKLAEAATPGPWKYWGEVGHEIFGRPVGPGMTKIFMLSREAEEADGEFIAAANPAVVLALIAERDAYRAALEGAGYRMLDNMTERGPEFSSAIGAAAATLAMGIQQERDQLKAQVDMLRNALKIFANCAYPVSKDIDHRGHRWGEAWLDEALDNFKSI